MTLFGFTQSYDCIWRFGGLKVGCISGRIVVARQQPNRKRYTPIDPTYIVDFARRDEMTDALTYLFRTAAPQLIATAVEAELASDLPQFTDVHTWTGHAALVCNRHHPARPFQTGLGLVNVGSLKVHSKGRITDRPQKLDLTITHH